MTLSPLSSIEVEERAASARAIINDPVFQDAFDMLHSQYLGILLQADVGGLTASTAHASIKVLHDVRSAFESMILDKKMHDRIKSKGVYNE